MIDILNLSLQFGGEYLYKNVSFKINSQDKIALIGSNGTGKSSLLKLLIGEISPEQGKIQKTKTTTIGYLPQENIIHFGKSLIDEATSALTDIMFLRKKEKEISQILDSGDSDEIENNSLINQLGEIHHKLEDLDSYSSDAKVKKILIGLGFTNDDFNKPTENFSGGWQMRIALAKILISQNDMLLLDEPTNHLDLDSLKWLTNFLMKYKGAVLIVSHDKYFINSITNKTLELFSGKFYVYNGNYDSYLKYKEERDELNIKHSIMQEKKIKETEKFIERFRYKATKAKQVQSRIKQLEKIELIDIPDTEKSIALKFPGVKRSGKTVIDLVSIKKSFGNNLVFSDVNLQINRDDKIAFVGPNGAGKTTLSKIIAGKLSHSSGEINLGHNVISSYYSQDVADQLNKVDTILETLEGMSSDLTQGQLRTLLGSFLFRGDDIYKKISVLSGGEKSRVALAKILLTKSNFIILDEPTNHLDIASSQLLKSALMNFTGSLIIVSHNIDFLRGVVNKVLDIRNNKITLYEGDIDYYLWKKESAEKNEIPQKVSNVEENKSSNKKELKRIEAEKRQKKYSATKILLAEIKTIEEKISELEKKKTEFEKTLYNTDLYQSPEKAKEITLTYNNTNNKLDEMLNLWEQKQIDLQEIESKFD